MILWYIRKFKDAYLVLLFGKFIENIFDKNKVETLQTLWKLDYLRVFFLKKKKKNYLDINYVFESTCIPVRFMLF